MRRYDSYMNDTTVTVKGTTTIPLSIRRQLGIEAGTQLSLREIERRVLPQMQGSEYLGPAYDSVARAYRLKFIREGRVSYVDVDARTGRIIGRSR